MATMGSNNNQYSPCVQQAQEGQSGTCWDRSSQKELLAKSGSHTTQNLGRIGRQSARIINVPHHDVVGQNPKSRDSMFIGEGDQEVLVKSSAHPKP
jgi:hypothetical protein